MSNIKKEVTVSNDQAQSSTKPTPVINSVAQPDIVELPVTGSDGIALGCTAAGTSSSAATTPADTDVLPFATGLDNHVAVKIYVLGDPVAVAKVWKLLEHSGEIVTQYAPQTAGHVEILGVDVKYNATRVSVVLDPTPVMNCGGSIHVKTLSKTWTMNQPIPFGMKPDGRFIDLLERSISEYLGKPLHIYSRQCSYIFQDMICAATKGGKMTRLIADILCSNMTKTVRDLMTQRISVLISDTTAITHFTLEGKQRNNTVGAIAALQYVCATGNKQFIADIVTRYVHSATFATELNHISSILNSLNGLLEGTKCNRLELMPLAFNTAERHLKCAAYPYVKEHVISMRSDIVASLSEGLWHKAAVTCTMLRMSVTACAVAPNKSRDVSSAAAPGESCIMSSSASI